ncbi:DUF4153 domain-containing protein [Janthinobacterium psychrotolerans]|uniref:DUF4153 domain-containing protein n=1 Tax=Janthinobacterium psychrotolerans TaxID=1747903 RepID=A0A1A7C7M6_9BURK|nr:DUF4153 domain-containing protein [Janthinobacterium psychrotolerans]OBV40770.1 protein of unknown function (DUF4153) [Janthinobacterium psychrotolerans]
MQAATGNPTVLLDPVVAPRIAVTRLAAGLLQGLLLYWLYSAAQARAWPATESHLLAPLMLIGLLLPVLLVSSLGHLSLRRTGLWMAGAALVLTALALHDVSRGGEHFLWGNYKPGAPLRVISAQLFGFCVVGFYIAHALVMASAQDGRRLASYATYFEIAWKLGIQLLFSLLFVAVLVLVLWLGGQLFLLIKLNFLKKLLGQAWFVIPVLCFAFSFAIHITDVRPSIVRGIRTLLLVLLSWLMPIAAVLVAGFLLTLPFIGFERLWATRHAASVLLGMAGLLVVLINAAFQNGQAGLGVARGIRFGTRLSCLLLPWLVGIAIYALTLRVMAHGWTSERIIAGACLLVASCYAAGYAWAASKYGDWLNWIANVNVGTAFIALLVMLALFSPLMDPARLSVASQMARLNAGKVSADKFDVEYLRFEGARYGQAALQQLSKRTGPDAAVIRARADAVLKRENRFDDTGVLSDVAINLTVRPAGSSLPDSFLRQDWSEAGPGWRLPACLKRAGQQCDAYLMDFDGDGRQEVLLISNDPRASSVLLAEKEGGGWYARGQIPTETLRCQPLREKLQAGQFALVPPKVRELEVDGQRIPMSLYNEQEVSCPEE